MRRKGKLKEERRRKGKERGKEKVNRARRVTQGEGREEQTRGGMAVLKKQKCHFNDKIKKNQKHVHAGTLHEHT